MKKNVSILLVCALALCLLAGCAAKQANVWNNATYKANTSLGEGAKAFTLDVTAEEKTVTFSIRTDKETVGDALLSLNLIAGEEGPYGLYIKTVNGITADYDQGKTYWAFYVNGEYGMTGVDMTPIVEGEKYGLVRSK